MVDLQLLPPSKFSPRPLGPNPLDRQRLLDVLEEHSHAKLVMIHAPAGYGKTTLMSQWHARLLAMGEGAGWITLDDDDNDSGRLVTALSRALSPRSRGDEDLFDAVNHCLQEHARFTLFLDEEERVTEEDAQHLFEVLLRLSPSAFHIVLGSRSQPQKLSTRLRIRSDYLEFTAQDLAFRPEEIVQFIRARCGITLDAEAKDYLARRTEGWAAVLQLAAADIARGEPVRKLFDHGGDPHSNLFQYLSDEVLIQLRPEQHDFLVQTAFIDELSGPLCDAVTGRADSASVLLELQQSNLLLQAADSSRRRFRYHALFAEFLQQQLRQRFPGRLAELARRASDWCAQAGESENAVEYALLAGDVEHLIACIRVCTDMLIARGQFSTAKRWLRAVPTADLRQQPDLLVWNVWVDLYTNDFAAAEANVAELSRVASSRAHVLMAFLALHRGRFDEAATATESAWHLLAPGDRRMQATIGNLRALLQQTRGLFAYAHQESERVLAIAGQSPAIWISFVHAAHISSMPEMSLGNLAAAWRQLELPERRLEDAERRGEAAGNRSQLLALLSGPKALILYLRNQLEDAQDSLERYEPFLNTMFSPSSRSEWHQLRVRLSALTGDEAACEQSLRAGIDYAARHGIGWMERMLLWQRVEYDLARGDLQRARAVATGLLERTRLDVAPEWIPSAEELFGPSMSALRFLVRSGEARRALEYLPLQIAHSERQLRRLRLMKLRILEAVARRELGEQAGAVEAIQAAVEVGHPTGAIRIYLDEGTECRVLLQELERSGRSHADAQDFLAKLRAAFEDSEAGENAEEPAPIHSMPLSTREMQIIQRLAEGHSNLAVGQQLFLSPNTVKWHLSQIYAKLGVKNRTQAVHVARQYNLTDLS